MSIESSSSVPDEGRDPSEADASGRAASDPDKAREAAEEALAQVEALADLDGPVEEAASTGGGEEGVASETSAEEPESGPTGHLEDQCENCGALLHGPYCSQCGQRAHGRIVPIWHMINEGLEAVIELDLRVIHTFPKFLFKPGRLTKEYINGRRKRYIRPVRLYLFATFVLFTVLALTTGRTFQFPFEPGASTAQADTVETASRPDSAGGGVSAATAAPAPSVFGDPEQRERWARQIEQNPDAVDVQIGDAETQSRLEQYLRVKVADAIRNPRDFVGSMIDRGPYIMFLMLPIFAFLLKILYIRRGRLYVEHLIFSLHVHALAFFAFTTGLLLDETGVGWLQTAATWVEFSPLLYLVIAMGHVYDQGFIKSTIKAFILLFVYLLVVTIMFVPLLLLLAIVLM